MCFESNNLIHASIMDEIGKSLFHGKLGIEKESIRFNYKGISLVPHYKILGNALYNRYITTDFSDSQLELITPPLKSLKENISFLGNLHSYVIKNMGDELMWPFSMPFFYRSDNEIPIAYYGYSNEAEFKHIYRRGLSNRYGSIMQTISGVHINYSLSADTIKILSDSVAKRRGNQVQSIIYFRMLRNVHRYSWLISYLFGSSPIVSKNFVTKKYDFIKLDENYFYLPNATSLRMSDLGYQNTNQSSINISLNNINDYADALKKATEKKSKKFEAIRNPADGKIQQLNESFLQIEDEYYSPARPKNSNLSSQRLSSKLKELGTDYLELRNFDLNPFSSIGINEKDLEFINLFLIFCGFYESDEMTSSDISEARSNQLLVTIEGRKPNLKLIRKGDFIQMTEWANQILNEMVKILDLSKNDSVMMKKYFDLISDPEKTRSSRILDAVIHHKDGYFDFGTQLALENKRKYLENANDKNPLQQLLDDEKLQANVKSEESLTDSIGLDDYLKSFYSS